MTMKGEKRRVKSINWTGEVLARKEALLGDLAGLLKIPSVKDAGTSEAGKPMGREIARALAFMLELAEREQWRTYNLDGYAGYAEYGPPESADYIGVLCHLDVVPAPGPWTSPPFEPEVRDGKLYARGAIDDKGPTMAAFYAMKIVKELGLPMKHRVRIIFGTDEEHTMSCMEHYRRIEKMPVAGFAPDAEFPIIHAEKGQINTRIVLQKSGDAGEQVGTGQGEMALIFFHSGSAANMVPASAEAAVTGELSVLKAIAGQFNDYCSGNHLKGTAALQDGTLVLSLQGKAAHGMEPQLGVNAGLKLVHFLRDYDFQPDARHFIGCLDDYFYDDPAGRRIGIACEDEIMGPLTVNVEIMRYEALECTEPSFAYLNIRFPLVADELRHVETIRDKVGKYRFAMEPPILKKPHHVAKEHPMIAALQAIYREETLLEPELLTTGGGTYASFLDNGVAFGALFPGKENVAHQTDEYIEIDELLQATVIYARAIYELANLDF